MKICKKHIDAVIKFLSKEGNEWVLTHDITYYKEGAFPSHDVSLKCKVCGCIFLFSEKDIIDIYNGHNVEITYHSKYTCNEFIIKSII